jgi:hypothetical protein
MPIGESSETPIAAGDERFSSARRAAQLHAACLRGVRLRPLEASDVD